MTVADVVGVVALLVSVVTLAFVWVEEIRSKRRARNVFFEVRALAPMEDGRRSEFIEFGNAGTGHAQLLVLVIIDGTVDQTTDSRFTGVWGPGEKRDFIARPAAAESDPWMFLVSADPMDIRHMWAEWFPIMDSGPTKIAYDAQRDALMRAPWWHKLFRRVAMFIPWFRPFPLIIGPTGTVRARIRVGRKHLSADPIAQLLMALPEPRQYLHSVAGQQRRIGEKATPDSSPIAD